MNCEFLKDENESIWFSFASSIMSRNIKGREVEKMKCKQLSNTNDDHRKHLLQQLELHKQR